MSPVFVDTSFYQAMVNPRDRWHGVALEFSRDFRGSMLTSEYVLCELGALMSQARLRPLFVELAHALSASSHVEILHASHAYFEEGMALFSSRPDKEWSLTDCVSFAMMQRLGISEALAFDHHFEQAGFRLLTGAE